MKPAIFLLSLSILITITTGCREESAEPTQPINIALLPGTWHLSDFQSSGTNSHQSGGNLSAVTYEMEGFDFASTTTFTENPNVFSTVGQYSYVLTVNRTDGVLDQKTVVLPSNALTGTWELDGNKLVEETATYTNIYTIEELTESRLTLRIDFHNVYEIEGVPITSTGFAIRTYQK